MSQLTVEFCGEEFPLHEDDTFTIGRDADLVVDEDNAYLHRRLVELRHEAGFWWITNVGSRLSVTVSGEVGTLQSWIGPGSRLPVVLPRIAVLFTAGDTTYEVNITCDLPTFESFNVTAPRRRRCDIRSRRADRHLNFVWCSHWPRTPCAGPARARATYLPMPRPQNDSVGRSRPSTASSTTSATSSPGQGSAAFAAARVSSRRIGERASSSTQSRPRSCVRTTFSCLTTRLRSLLRETARTCPGCPSSDTERPDAPRRVSR